MGSSAGKNKKTAAQSQPVNTSTEMNASTNQLSTDRPGSNQGSDIGDGRNSNLSNRSQTEGTWAELNQEGTSSPAKNSLGSKRSPPPATSPRSVVSRQTNASKNSAALPLDHGDTESVECDDRMGEAGGSQRSQSKGGARGSPFQSPATSPVPAIATSNKTTPVHRSPSPHEHCSHCPHCQRLLTEKNKPKINYPWITDNPGLGVPLIEMENYDVDAVNKKLIMEHGHLPGCYDYRPYLTIEDDFRKRREDDFRKCSEVDFQQCNEVGGRETFVTRKKKPITPMRTPYPDCNVIQRREQRLNKPYTQDLYVD